MVSMQTLVKENESRLMLNWQQFTEACSKQLLLLPSEAEVKLINSSSELLGQTVSWWLTSSAPWSKTVLSCLGEQHENKKINTQTEFNPRPGLLLTNFTYTEDYKDKVAAQQLTIVFVFLLPLLFPWGEPGLSRCCVAPAIPLAPGWLYLPLAQPPQPPLFLWLL